MSATVWIGVGVLGGAGAVARFLLDAGVSARVPGPFPSGTFVVNVSGALALGLLAGLSVDGDALVLMGAAALGSFTTFSTWMFETDRAVEDGLLRVAALNVALTAGVGLGAAELGRLVGGVL